MNHNELRNEFLDFFKTKKHKIVASSPVIPYDDPSLMFTNAGMNQFKEVLSGNETRSYNRAASIQKCIRVSGKHNDFEIVGFDGTHHTFFEMLGNWSFGDYYKEEAIQWSWEFITKICKLPEEHLAVSIYKDDNESFNIWKNMIKIPEEKIVRLGNIDKGDEENFWSMGETGPCGFCTEIHYNKDNKKNKKITEKILNEEYIELWNLVFMEFYRNVNRDFTPLKNKNVDTGMGFERLLAIIQGKKSNYHTDLFMPLIHELENLSDKKYKSNEISFQVIADHIRTLTFAIADGCHFSNEGRGYVLRKILRRALRHLKKLDISEPILYKLVDTVIDIMDNSYKDLREKKNNIKKFIRIEEEKFLTTLDKGLNQLNNIIKQIKKSKKMNIPGEEIFNLYDRFGFPVDITKEIAKENDLKIDEPGFQALMEEQKERGRQSWESDKKLLNMDIISRNLINYPLTSFCGYETTELENKILAIIDQDKIIEKYNSNNNTTLALLLEKSPFYAEAGGQVGDQGTIFNQEFEFQVMDTQKYANYILHFGTLNYGHIKINDKVITSVNNKQRTATMRNHTATHLLHASLRKIVGDHIVQAGSFVSSERLRFDFRHYEAIKKEQIDEIEKMVNSVIQNNIKVEKTIKDKEDAIKMGAMAIFGEKYGEKVRVIKIDNFSTELCGGTHINSTGEIGIFLILSEMSIASGIRRIEALTGTNALNYIQKVRKNHDNIKDILKVSDKDIVSRVGQLLNENKEMEKKLKSKKFNNINDIISQLKNSAMEKNKSRLILHIFENKNNKLISTIGDNLLKQIKSGIILLFNSNKDEDKFSVLLLITENLIKKGVKANHIIKKVSLFFNGSGGGRDDRAQAGGKNCSLLNDIMEKSKKLLLNLL